MYVCECACVVHIKYVYIISFSIISLSELFDPIDP